MLDKISRYWKEGLAVLLLIAIIVAPGKFLVYNLDMGFMLVKLVGGLLLARVAKTAYDSWQSRPVKDKTVSISKFMATTDNELAKGIVHASQIICIAVIIAAALSS